MSEKDLAMKETAKAGSSLDTESSLKYRSTSRRAAVRPQKKTLKREAQLSRSRRSSNINRNMVVPKAVKDMVFPYEPLSISFECINYYVGLPPEMKHEVDVSGAGKTTLMDVLARRKTCGYVEDDIRISGYPKVHETFARISGYCEQNGIHSSQLDVRESLVYSAWLCLDPDISDEDKLKIVDQVMKLSPVEHALVGLLGTSGLSIEQRKRQTIAIELVASPSIIFMDEPTSGLDTRAAAFVMRTVRNTVDTGKSVVCAIHQPSIDIFKAFDELLLLKRGGLVIYNGPLGHNSEELIEYFQLYLIGYPWSYQNQEGYNPATWMLEVTNNRIEDQLGVDFAMLYLTSDLYWSKDLCFETKYYQNYFKQLKTILWKQFITYWRSPDYNLVRFIFTLL
uniref:ABC transporter domain-containing protein n=2 Tax=Physcomitrium patens TaxID=3218 RepID=A0A7I4BJM6_PHYPA